jgi:hypothetical protein
MSRIAIEAFYEQLAGGHADELLTWFGGRPALDTPLDGAIAGEQALRRWVATQESWLRERAARSETVAVIATPARTVAELVLFLQDAGGTVDLPVVLVAEPGSGPFAAVRVYHSTWPLSGAHAVRAPLLAPAAHLEEPPTIERYMSALARAEKEAILALFAPEGYVREPSGARYRHAGEAGRRAFFDLALGAGGGVPLKHCTATFDGRRFAVEYVCDEWGRTKFPPQAGMAVYELDDDGRLLAVRIYDDVSPPGEHSA